MQKKKLISIAITLTLQSYYIPAIAAENNNNEKECPSNISSLPKEKRAKLSPTCLATPENDNHWGWVAGGVAALVAGVAIGVENNGGGDSNHSYAPPTPDNGGNVTPPDDGGDDDDTPPDDSVITFSNGVTIDKGKAPLTFDSFKLDNGSILEGAVWNYSEQDNQWQLTTADGKTLNVTGRDVTNANAAVIEGTQEDGLYWKYDSRGYLIIADDNTTVISGDDQSHNSDRGMDISGQDRTGTVINSNNARVNNDGDMTITDGGTGAHITGDSVVIDNAGSTTVSGADATALYIDGDNALVINEGNQTISGGAVGTRIDGDDAHITNTGDIAVDGADSAAVVINGDNGSLTQAGDLLVTDGAMGIITYGTGNEAKNTGNATVRDADSVGFVIAGEKNTFKNKGDIDVSLNGTGTQVSGNMSQVTLDGDINVTAVEDSDSVYCGATGIDITGDNNDSGVINSDTTVSGNLVNDGTISGKLTQNGGDIVNNGTIDSRSLTTGGVLTHGTDGTMTSGAKVTGANSAIINDGTFQLGSATDATNASMLEINDYVQFFNTGTLILDNNKNAIHLNPNNGTLYNTGTMDLTATSNKGAINYWGAGATFINDGTVNATTAALAYAAGDTSSAPDQHAFFNSGNETAVDSIVGLKLNYAGKDGWSATATLEGGPNLSYSKSQRTASLQGAAGQSFGVDDGQKGGGVNGLATIGVKYSSNDTALHLDAYQWKEDGISDKGFMLNVKKTFR
ncbi:hypothetical protein CHK55_09465 [Salmonella enterica]|nr:hypothetical protein [Salmonella enterica]